jgi:hypothetical protein
VIHSGSGCSQSRERRRWLDTSWQRSAHVIRWYETESPLLWRIAFVTRAPRSTPNVLISLPCSLNNLWQSNCDQTSEGYHLPLVRVPSSRRAWETHWSKPTRRKPRERSQSCNEDESDCSSTDLASRWPLTRPRIRVSAQRALIGDRDLPQRGISHKEGARPESRPNSWQ